MASGGLEMDQDTALELVKKGATLLLLDVPQYTLFGIDTQMFAVGPNFRGIKMIPDGPHFIYYSASNREGNEFSPVIGFFIVTCPSEVVVRRWHQQEERLVQVSEDEELRYAEAVKHLEFDRYLGPYMLNRFGEWKQLSGYITKNTIERIEPIGGEITIIGESELVGKVPRTAMEKHLAEQLKNSKFLNHAREDRKGGCYYTTIPHVVKQHSISGEELTALNLDKTRLLETILMKDFEGSEDRLLGELQFAFIAFMMGQSLEAFLQWKALVSLFFGCVHAPLRTRTQLFIKFLKVLYCQLKHGFQKGQDSKDGVHKGVAVSLDDAWFSNDIFLYRLCKDFFPLVLETPVVDGDLLSWTRRLKKLLESALGWDFQDVAMDASEETDEYSPVVVPPGEAALDEDSST